jgi:hypothetical protein
MAPDRWFLWWVGAIDRLDERFFGGCGRLVYEGVLVLITLVVVLVAALFLGMGVRFLTALLTG